MAHYAFIHRPGPNWLPNTPILGQSLADHFAYMGTLPETGTLVNFDTILEICQIRAVYQFGH